MIPPALRSILRWPRSATFVVLLGAGVPACRAPRVEPAPEPSILAPVGLLIEQRSFAGTLLGGPQDLRWNPKEVRAWKAEVALIGRSPAAGLTPLAALWKLIAQPDAEQPVRGTSNLWMGSQFADGETAQTIWDAAKAGSYGGFRMLYEGAGVVFLGTATVVRLAAQEIVPDPDNFLRERPERGILDKSVAWGVEFDGQTIQLGFALQNLAREAPSEAREDDDRPKQTLQMEWALPDIALDPEGMPLLVLLPSPFQLLPAQAVLVRVEQVEAEEAQVTLAAQALTATRAQDTQPESEADARVRPLRKALEALCDPTGDATQRGPWLFLASSEGLSLTRDLVLTAEPALLARWAALLPAVPAEAVVTAEQIGWILERAAWVCLARETLKETVPDACVALLLRHAGEVGRYPSTIEDAALQAADGATMQQRLAQENRLFLEDSSPAARVRAFDWLLRQGETVSGFDPLAGKAERRTALRALEAASSEEGIR